MFYHGPGDDFFGSITAQDERFSERVFQQVAQGEESSSG